MGDDLKDLAKKFPAKEGPVKPPIDNDLSDLAKEFPLKKKDFSEPLPAPGPSASPAPAGTLSLPGRSVNTEPPTSSAPVATPAPQGAQVQLPYPQSITPPELPKYRKPSLQRDLKELDVEATAKRIEDTKAETDKQKIREQAYNLANGGKPAAASAVADILSQKFPDDPYAHQIKAHAMETDGDLTGAESELTAALTKAPQNTPYYQSLLAQRAELNQKLGREDQATSDALSYIDKFQMKTGDLTAAKTRANMAALAGNQADADYWQKYAEGIESYRRRGIEGRNMIELSDWIQQKLAQVQGVGKVPAEMLTAGVEKIGEGLPNLMVPESPEKFIKESAPKLASGAISLYFGTMGATPAGMAFNAAISAGQLVGAGDVVDWAMAPVSKVLAANGIDESKFSEWGKLVTEVVNFIPMMLFMHGYGKVAEKLSRREPLNGQDISDIDQAFASATPESIRATAEAMDKFKADREAAHQVSDVQKSMGDVPTYRIDSKLYPREEFVAEVQKRSDAGMKDMDLEVAGDDATQKQVEEIVEGKVTTPTTEAIRAVEAMTGKQTSDALKADQESFDKDMAERDERTAIIEKVIKSRYGKDFDNRYVGMYPDDGWGGEAKKLWNTPIEELRAMSAEPAVEKGEEAVEPSNIIYVPEQEQKSNIEEFTHYGGGAGNKSVRTTWANWFLSQDRPSKERIAKEIEDNPKLKNSLISSWYDEYKKETGSDITFEEFLNTDVEVYRGETAKDAKGTPVNGFQSYAPTFDEAKVWANRGTGKVITKTVKPKDSYGLIQSVGAEREILIPEPYSDKFMESVWDEFANKNSTVFDKLTDEQATRISTFVDEKNYRAAIDEVDKIKVANSTPSGTEVPKPEEIAPEEVSVPEPVREAAGAVEPPTPTTNGQTKEGQGRQEVLDPQQQAVAGAEAPAKGPDVRREPTQGTYGRDEQVKFTDELAVPSKYKLIEVDDLEPSHTGSGERNPNHHIASAQPKERNDRASMVVQDKIASNPNFKEVGDSPNAYFGTPVVNDRGEVIQGNNRSIGLKKHYANGGTSYKVDLAANAERFGLTADQVNEMKNPILVREVKVDDAEAVSLGQHDVKDLETGGKQRIDPIATSRKMTPEDKSDLTALLFGDEFTTIKDGLRTNGKAVFNILKKYLNPAQNKNTFNANGEFTQKGIDDVEALITNFLFDGGDPTLPEVFDNMPASIQKSLFKSMPAILSASAEKSIRPEVQNALMAIYKFTNSEFPTFDVWTRTQDMFAGGSPQELFPPADLEIARRLMDAKTQKEVVDLFKKYADAIRDKEADMFQDATPGMSKKDAIKETLNVEYNEKKPANASQQTAGQGDNANEPGEPVPPGSGEEKGKANVGTPTVQQLQEELARGKWKGKMNEFTQAMESARATRPGDALRKLKINKPGSGKLQSNILGAPIAVWDGLIETLATGMDAGVALGKLIQQGIEELRKSDWYKSLTTAAKAEKEKSLDGYFRYKVMDLGYKEGSEVKERKFFRSIQDATNISQETKDLLNTDPENRLYVVKKNEISKQQARDYIEDFGLEQTVKDLLDPDVEMLPSNRNFLAMEAMRQSDEIALKHKTWGNMKAAEEYFDQSTSLAEDLIRRATESGRAVQALSTLGTPDRIVYNTRKAVNRKRKENGERDKEKIEREKTKTKEKVKEATEETLKGKDIQEKIRKARRKPADPAESLAKRIVNRLGGDKKKFDPIREMVNVLFGKVNETLEKKEPTKEKPIDKLRRVLQNKDEYAGTWEQAKIKVQEMMLDKGFPKDVIEEYNRQLEAFYNEVIGKPYNEGMVESATSEAMKSQGVDLNELIRKHYTVYDATKRTLVEKMIEDAGVVDEDARLLADAVGKAFDRAARKRIQGVIDQMLNRGTKSGSKRKTSTEYLLEMVNMGAFSDDQFISWYADTHDWAHLTPDNIAELHRLADAVYKAPDGFQKYRANENLMKFQRKMGGITWGEVGQAFWYANVLSGLPTHTVNFLANVLNSSQLIANAAVRNPKQLPAMLLGFAKGLEKGWYEAGATMKTGYAPVKAGKLEFPHTLEIKEFAGGNKNPVNWAKFVTRAMVASDMLSYSANKEMREYQLARMQAKKDGLHRVTIKDIQDRLFNTQQRIADAEAQARQEGLKGRDYKRRVFELVEQSRPVEMVDDAATYASRATFNYRPEGTLGVLTDAINSATTGVDVGGFKPLKLLVPFTNIISNVANNTIDYTPYGYVRAMKGGVGWSGMKKGKWREYTLEERQDELVKASIGLIAMAAMYSLTEPDDKENSLIEITAGGTGDFKKNYELKQLGWKEYSIRIGNEWISYQYSPLALALAPIGFLRDREKYHKETVLEDGVGAIFSYSLYNSMKFMLDMTFMGTLNNVVGAISSDNPRSGMEMLTNTASNTAKGFITPNLFTQTMKQYNEWFNIPTKDAHTVIEKLYKDVPVVKNGLYDKLNALGDPVVLQTDRIETNVKNDVIWEFIVKNNAFIGTPSKRSIVIEKPKPRECTNEEYYNFIKERGRIIKFNIESLMERAKKNPSEYTKEKIQESIDSYKKEATKLAKSRVFNK